MKRHRLFGWDGLSLAGTVRPIPRLGWHRLRLTWGDKSGHQVSHLPILDW